MNSKAARVLICCLIGAMLPDTLPAVDLQPIGKAISAESLCLMYASSPSALERYEKKRNEVHGTVLSLNRTSDGLPVLLLSGGAGAPFAVRCVFPLDAAAKLSNILPSMHVIVEGELQGKTGDVIFTGCKLLRTF